MENIAESQRGYIAERVILSLTGALAGAANGLFGAGGGMLVVPMLVVLLGREQRRAHATAILIILPLAVTSGIVYASFGAFPPLLGSAAAAGVVAGGFSGALLLRKIQNKWLSVIFALVTLAAGLRMVF